MDFADVIRRAIARVRRDLRSNARRPAQGLDADQQAIVTQLTQLEREMQEYAVLYILQRYDRHKLKDEIARWNLIVQNSKPDVEGETQRSKQIRALSEYNGLVQWLANLLSAMLYRYEQRKQLEEGTWETPEYLVGEALEIDKRLKARAQTKHKKRKDAERDRGVSPDSVRDMPGPGHWEFYPNNRGDRTEHELAQVNFRGSVWMNYQDREVTARDLYHIQQRNPRIVESVIVWIPDPPIGNTAAAPLNAPQGSESQVVQTAAVAAAPTTSTTGPAGRPGGSAIQRRVGTTNLGPDGEILKAGYSWMWIRAGKNGWKLMWRYKGRATTRAAALYNPDAGTDDAAPAQPAGGVVGDTELEIAESQEQVAPVAEEGVDAAASSADLQELRLDQERAAEARNRGFVKSNPASLIIVLKFTPSKKRRRDEADDAGEEEPEADEYDGENGNGEDEGEEQSERYESGDGEIE